MGLKAASPSYSLPTQQNARLEGSHRDCEAGDLCGLEGMSCQ